MRNAPTTASGSLKTAIVSIACAAAFVCAAHDGPHPKRKAALAAAEKTSLAADAPSSDVTVRTRSNLRAPDIEVIDTRGRSSRLAASLNTAEPVLLNFVYTTCSTICSTQTAVLAEFQRRLLAEGRRARFVTLTIDPYNDTPERLAAFAKQFDITRDWSFFSGGFDELLRVQQAFDVYRGSKASHPPVVMMRPAPGADWVRIEGIAAPADLLAIFDGRWPRR